MIVLTASSWREAAIVLEMQRKILLIKFDVSWAQHPLDGASGMSSEGASSNTLLFFQAPSEKSLFGHLSVGGLRDLREGPRSHLAASVVPEAPSTFTSEALLRPAEA